MRFLCSLEAGYHCKASTTAKIKGLFVYIVASNLIAVGLTVIKFAIIYAKLILNAGTIMLFFQYYRKYYMITLLFLNHIFLEDQ